MHTHRPQRLHDLAIIRRATQLRLVHLHSPLHVLLRLQDASQS